MEKHRKDKNINKIIAFLLSVFLYLPNSSKINQKYFISLFSYRLSFISKLRPIIYFSTLKRGT